MFLGRVYTLLCIVFFLVGTSLAQEKEALSIRDAVKLALEQNEQINQTRESAIQATARYEQLNALKMPTLGISGQTTGQHRQSIDTTAITENVPGAGTFPPELVILEPIQVQANATLGILLTSFGKVENQIVGAFLQAKAEQEQLEVTRQQLVNQTKVAYVGLLSADEAIVAAEQNLHSTRDHLKETEVLLKNGLVSEFELVKAEQELAQAEEDLATTRTQREIAVAQLLFVLNEDPPFRFELQPPEDPTMAEDVVIEDLKKLGQLYRPEKMVADTSLEAADKLVKAAYAENNPSLNLSFNYFRQAGSNLQPDAQGQVILGFQIPLFDGGVRKAMVKEAESSYRALESTHAILTDQIDLEVATAYQEFHKASVQVKAALKELELAEVSHRMAQARYKHGISTSLELEDTLRTLTSARAGLVVARNSLGLAFLKMELALGLEVPDYKLSLDFVKEKLEGVDE